MDPSAIAGLPFAGMQLLRRLICLFPAGRESLRAQDVREWPVVWEMCGRDPSRFLDRVGEHTASDPAWKYAQEWGATELNPTRWLARIKPVPLRRAR